MRRRSDYRSGSHTNDITAVRFTPVRSAAHAKLRQRASHFAIAGAAAALDVKDGTIVSARVGLTGAAPAALRLTAVERALTGRAATHEMLAAAARLAAEDLSVVNSDIHASAGYWRAMSGSVHASSARSRLVRASAEPPIGAPAS